MRYIQLPACAVPGDRCAFPAVCRDVPLTVMEVPAVCRDVPLTFTEVPAVCRAVPTACRNVPAGYLEPTFPGSPANTGHPRPFQSPVGTFRRRFRSFRQATGASPGRFWTSQPAAGGPHPVRRRLLDDQRIVPELWRRVSGNPAGVDHDDTSLKVISVGEAWVDFLRGTIDVRFGRYNRW